MITSTTWRGKRYAVLGLARSGRATVDALLASGAEVVAWDSDPARRHPSESWDLSRNGSADAALYPLPQGERDSAKRRERGLTYRESPLPRSQEVAFPSPLEGEGRLSFADPLTLDLTGFTAVVVSPGVPLNRHPIAGHAAKFGVPVIGDIELFAQVRSELPPHKVVGITGTNGKSTTTALVHHILAGAGVPTTMGGNIGLPILGQEPLPAGGVYVLELSSFQIDLTFTLDCDVAVLLNVTPDHLDRYASFEAYTASKARLFGMQTFRHLAIVPQPNEFDDLHFRITDRFNFARLVRPSTQGIATTGIFQIDTAIFFDGKFYLDRGDWPNLQGPHNTQNVVAAIAIAIELRLLKTDVQRGLATYPGLPHRMERVRERDGVLYVNDSKATNPTSTAPALAAYPAVRWILGGQAKTAELDACAPHFGHVRSAYAIGEAGPMFAELLRAHMPVEASGTLAQAVAHAARDAQAGDTVLLSPACASFDQFRDYEDRGDQFRTLVEAL